MGKKNLIEPVQTKTEETQDESSWFPVGPSTIFTEIENGDVDPKTVPTNRMHSVQTLV